MKCAELAKHVEALGQFAKEMGGSDQSARALCRVLSVSPSKSVVQLVKSIGVHSAPGNVHDSLLAVADFSRLVKDALGGFVKAALVKDLESLAVALSRVGNMTIDQLVSALSSGGQTGSRRPSAPSSGGTTSELRENLIQRHFRLLEQALGDDAGFAAAYRALETDGDMRVGELVALAKRFAYASVKSRPSALKKIMARHQALMTSRAKSAATDGRLAG